MSGRDTRSRKSRHASGQSTPPPSSKRGELLRQGRRGISRCFRATAEASGAAVGDVKAGVALVTHDAVLRDASRATTPGSQLGEARPPDRIVVRARARDRRQAMASGAPRRASRERAPARSKVRLTLLVSGTDRVKLHGFARASEQPFGRPGEQFPRSMLPNSAGFGERERLDRAALAPSRSRGAGDRGQSR